MEHKQLKFEKGLELLGSLSKETKSAIICSFLINPWALKTALGKNFPYNSLLLLSGEKSIEIQQSIKTKKFLDSSCIPLLGHSFHSKLYLFEKSTATGSHLDLLISSFNATSAGLSQNLEFWSYAQATINTEKFQASNMVDLILGNTANVDCLHWSELCTEENNQLVVAPALEVLWRLSKNGRGLAPGKPKCIPDVVISSKQYLGYDSLFVHTLGNNSLSKALELMISEAIDKNENVWIRIASPYHNIEGIKYIHKKCIDALKDKKLKITIELLTVFPPDFPEKFSDPKTQPFATLKDIEKISGIDSRISLHIRLWKKDSDFAIPEIDENSQESRAQSVFLHGKVVLSKIRTHLLVPLGIA